LERFALNDQERATSEAASDQHGEHGVIAPLSRARRYWWQLFQKRRRSKSSGS
jgi:hypothetical protein